MVKHPHTLGFGMTSQRSRERLVARLRESGISDGRVLGAINSVPRHAFVDEALASRAYDDTALPIGHGQTISQPFIVARMTELLLRDGVPENVLEVGTGSGYQTAVLAELVPTVYTVERIRALHEQARQRLKAQGYYRVRARYTDGIMGLPQFAPFEGIIVTAGSDHLPEALLQQLKPGGRLVLPVGELGHQVLRLVWRTGDAYEAEDFEAVSFVPLVADKL